MKFYSGLMLIYCSIFLIIVSGMNYNKENHEIIDNANNEEQFYCEGICYKLHPFGIKTKCGHKFCLSCIYKMREQTPSLCAYCRTPLSCDFINDYSFVNVNMKNLNKIEIEDLQNCFPVLPLLPETTYSDILRWLSKDTRIDVNFVCPLNGGTALCTAAYSGNFDIMKCLVRQGANTDHINNYGAIALHYATKQSVEMVKYFLKLGANIDQNGKCGTPLFWAARFGNEVVVKYLILNKAKINLESLEEHRTPLLAAVYFGHFTIVQFLVEEGAKINYNLAWCGTALCCGVENGHLEIVKYLIQKNADINLGRKSSGYTPLIISTIHNNLEIVRILLENEVDVNKTAVNGYAAVHFAAQFGFVEIIKHLIQNRADINLGTMETESTPLIIALMYKNFEIAKIFLENGADVHKLTLNGGVALHFAAQFGSLEIVQLLINKKADVNSGTITTSLIVASCNNDIEIVKLLLKNKGDVNKPGINGHTALHCAAQCGYLQIVEYLIKNNADVNQNVPNFGTPLILASMEGQFDVVKCLIQNNAEINICTTTELSALHVCLISETGSLEILKYLIKNGANVNVNTKIGSPLHFAASYGSLKMMKVLIYHGASVNSVEEGEFGYSPLHVAVENSFFEICKYLINHGANINKKTKNGFSAYDLAKSNGDVLLAEFLSQKHGLDIIPLK